MSGTISQIVGRADLAASLIFGGQPVVTLGPIAFAYMEIPEKITWGGKQQVTVHKLPGGARVIDVMGRDDADISWSGIFLNDATSRAQAVDELRIAGDAVQLTWGPFSYTVVVTSFEADTRSFQVPYRITCAVVQDNTASQPQPQPTILQQVNADLNAAAGFDVAGTVAGAISVAQQAVGVLSVITGGIPAVVALQADIGAVSGAVTGVVGAVSGAIGAVTGAISGVISTAQQSVGLLSAITGGSPAVVALQADIGAASYAVGAVAGLANGVLAVASTAMNVVSDAGMAISSLAYTVAAASDAANGQVAACYIGRASDNTDIGDA